MEIENIFSLGDLFERVQLENIFPDSKTFVDCTPKMNLSIVRSRYDQERNYAWFDLKLFVHEYFEEPKTPFSNFKSELNESVSDHIENLWNILTRSPKVENDSFIENDSLIDLPYPYIVPGGRFREIYYWDSYFTMLGLKVSKRFDLIENMISNFAWLIDQYGYIPNGNRTYYLGRSQPPFFAAMVQLLTEEKGEEILTKYLPQLEKEHHFWMKGRDQLNSENTFLNRVVLMPDGNILNHYWDEHDTPRPESFKEDAMMAVAPEKRKEIYRHIRAAAESGWDFSSRWFKDKNDFSTIHTTEIIPVDLNCLLWNLESLIAKAYQLSGNLEQAEKFTNLALGRKASVEKYCWNQEKGFYFDYDYIENRQKDLFTMAAAFPLFFGIASGAHADKVAQALEQKFLSPGGLLTTQEPTGQQWDAPNGWAPLQWIAITGLRRYNFATLAEETAHRWMELNTDVYKRTGKMMEKYNVENIHLTAGGGEYPAQDGFGWTNGVYLALKAT